jgi:hypothetical protein
MLLRWQADALDFVIEHRVELLGSARVSLDFAENLGKVRFSQCGVFESIYPSVVCFVFGMCVSS